MLWYYLDGESRRFGPYETKQMSTWLFHPKQHVSLNSRGPYAAVQDLFDNTEKKMLSFVWNFKSELRQSDMLIRSYLNELREELAASQWLVFFLCVNIYLFVCASGASFRFIFFLQISQTHTHTQHTHTPNTVIHREIYKTNYILLSDPPILLLKREEDEEGGVCMEMNISSSSENLNVVSLS